MAVAGQPESTIQRHTFAVGVGISSVEFKEDIEIFDVEVEQQGAMYELMGDYTYHNDLMLHAGLSYSTGELDYDGYTQSGTPVSADSEDWIVECRGLVGYDCVLSGKHLLTPFVGMGYRYWNGELEQAGDDERETEYWYVALGIRTYSVLSENWTCGTSLEYDLLVEGEVDYARPYAPRYNLDSGYGARFSLRFSRQWAQKTAVFFEPYVTYWNIDKTDVIVLTLPGPDPGEYAALDMWEPDNDTITYGLRIGLEF